LKATTGHHFSGEFTMSNTELKTVKVAEFRNAYDNLYRQSNVHYHSCVGANEVRNWKVVAERVLAQTKLLQCSRANEYDKEQMANAIRSVTERLAAADARIEELDERTRQLREKAQRAEQAPQAKPQLQLIQGGRLH
jgi:hypothetical protein